MIELPDILAAKILIVDDQETNIILLTQMLNEESYTDITSTISPQDVCQMHRQRHFDLILLDLQMPVMDGFQVMESLKTIHSDAYLPVIVLTAQPGHKLRALQAGAKDFISKPFDLLEIKTRIHNMLVVKLLYKKLENYNEHLEQELLKRTAELRESEARYRSLTELASDWYWEQDENMNFTKVSGPVLEMLGIQVESITEGLNTNNSSIITMKTDNYEWNKQEHEELLKKINAREPFLDLIFSRMNADGSKQRFQVSGEPMFDWHCRFIGYRGIGIELSNHP